MIKLIKTKEQFQWQKRLIAAIIYDSFEHAVYDEAQDIKNKIKDFLEK